MRPCFVKHNKDHWGYFTVGRLKTYSKLEAIELSSKTGFDIEWHFNDEVFDRYDWSKEPPGDLLFWYGERARQLRDTYDYLVLLYSGGADSHNILRAFVDNNIFVDEIVQVVMLEGSSLTKDDEANKECFVTSIPQTQKLLESNPVYKNTKHTVIDGGKFNANLFSTLNMDDYWYEVSNGFFSPWGITMQHLKDIEPSYKHLSDLGKKVCFVWGYGKFEFLIRDNEFYVKFSETGQSSLVSPKQQRENEQWRHDEMFYWTPDLPELIAKQAHVVKNYLDMVNYDNIDNINIKNFELLQDEKYGLLRVSSLTRFTKNARHFQLTEEGLHSLIYPYWINGTVSCPKAPSPLFGKKDDWIWTSNNREYGLKKYFNGVVWLKKHVKNLDSSMWWEKPVDKARARYCGGFKTFVRKYKITTQRKL